MNNNKLLVTGIIGVIASLLMFTGDMLLYFTTDPVLLDIENGIIPLLGTIPNSRLMAGALCGPLSSILYVIGFSQVYLATKQEHKKWGLAVFALFATGIIIGGSYHAIFAPLGFISASGNTATLATMLTFLKLVREITFAFAKLSFILFAIVVLRKQTLYPRWIVLFTPLVTIWFWKILQFLPQPFAIIFAGGWTNIVFLIFFIASTLSLKNKIKKPLAIGD